MFIVLFHDYLYYPHNPFVFFLVPFYHYIGKNFIEEDKNPSVCFFNYKRNIHCLIDFAVYFLSIHHKLPIMDSNG